jgi:hypothetical protein
MALNFGQSFRAFGTPILKGKCKNSEPDDMNQALLNAHAQSVISIDAEDEVEILSVQSAAMLHHSRLLTIRLFVKFKR